MEKLAVKFAHQLVHRVRAFGLREDPFILGRNFGIAISRRAGGEDKPFDLSVTGGHEHVENTVHIRLMRRDRIGHRFRYAGDGCFVVYHLRAVDRLLADLGIADIAFDQFDFIEQVFEIFAFAGTEIVQHANFFASLEKSFRQVRTDKPRAAGDQK